MISPVKASVGPGYDQLDKRLAAAIHMRFGLSTIIPAALKKQIKKADKVSAWLEATQLAGFSKLEADKLFGKVDEKIMRELKVVLRPPVEVRHEFMRQHANLLSKI
jgi:5'-deoxynucleotidase YfbR-like HD superfamily hydrolase